MTDERNRPLMDSPFLEDADPREVIHRRRDYIERDAAGNPQAKSDIVHVRVAINKAALASQAVGPIINEVEMSYLDALFPTLPKSSGSPNTQVSNR